jgi:hypothetical protein
MPLNRLCEIADVRTAQTEVTGETVIVFRCGLTLQDSHYPKETKMKLALIGAAAVAAAAFATPALAQAGSPYTDNGYHRDWQGGNAMMSQHASEPDAYRYHGGSKTND